MAEDTGIKKELILVNPAPSDWLYRLVFKLCFQRNIPSALLTLCALTPKDYKIKIMHQKFFWRKNDFPAGALVGITCLTASAPAAYKLADQFRKAGAYVVMGGPHVSCLPEEALRHCDSVVIDEAESVWQEVVKDFENKSLKRIYQGVVLQDFFSVVYDYFLRLDPKVLFRSGLMLSRGCRYHCDFCARPFRGPRFAKLEQVIEIVRRMKQSVKNPLIRRPAILFKDDNIFSDPAYAKELFRALIPLEIAWAANSSLDIAFDEEALSLARQSGCRALFIGFESIYPQKLEKTALPGLACPKDFLKPLKKIHSFGIKVFAAFIIGFDYYTHLDYLRLLRFLLVPRFFYVSMTIMTPYPGTPLFERLKKEGRITTFNWAKYNLLFHVVFRPKNMPAFLLLAWFLLLRLVSFFLCAVGLAVVLIVFLPYIIGLISTGYHKWLSYLYGVQFYE